MGAVSPGLIVAIALAFLIVVVAVIILLFSAQVGIIKLPEAPRPVVGGIEFEGVG